MCLQVVKNGWVEIVDSQMTENFLYIKKLISVFHVNILQQLQIPVNSVNGKDEKIPSKTFSTYLIYIANKNINSKTFR